MAVSDGLVFRSGLAAWRDPSFDTGLAHGLLSSAPGGLVHGVARPANSAPASHSGGGPLLLRALAPGGDELNSGAPEGASDAPVLPGVRRERTAPESGRRPAAARSDSRAQSTPSAGAHSAVAPEPPQVRHQHDLPPVQRTAQDDNQPARTRTPGAEGFRHTRPGPSAARTQPRPETPRVRREQTEQTEQTEQRAEGAPAKQGAPRKSPADGPQTSPRSEPPRIQRRARDNAEPRIGGNSTSEYDRSPAARTDSPASPAATARGQGQRSSPATAQTAGQRDLPFERTAPVLNASAPAEQTSLAPPTSVQAAGAPGRLAAPSPSPSRLPLVRQVAVVPARTAGAPSAAAAHVGHGTSAPSGRTAPPRSVTKAAAPSAPKREPEPGRPESNAAGTVRPTVRPRPVSRPLTVARRTADPVRRVSAVRPAAPSAGPGNGTTDGPARARSAHAGPQTATSAASTPAASAPAATTPPTLSDAPVQRAPGRAPLGAPLTGLPPTATPLVPPSTAGNNAPGPALPVVQSRADDSAGPQPARPEGGGHQPSSATPSASGAPTPPAAPTRSGPARPTAPKQPAHRPRTGLGAPLSTLPPSADLPVPGSRTGRASGPDTRTAVQRTSAATPAAPTAPAAPESGGRLRQAPLLGPSPASDTSQDSTSHPGAPRTTGAAGGPDALVQRRVSGDTGHGETASTASRASQSTGGGAPGAAHHGGPVPLVAARTVAAPDGVVGPRPRSTPMAQPTVQLLTARPLTLGTEAGTGTGARVAAPPTRGRPVVAARWARETAAADGGPPAPGAAHPSTSATPLPGLQRAPAAAGPPPAPRVVSPEPLAQPRVVPVVRPQGSAPARPLPVTGPVPRLPTVQPLLATAPKQPTPLRAAPPKPAAPQVQRDPDPAASGKDTGTTTEATSAQGEKAAAKGAGNSGSHEKGKAAQDPGNDLDELARRLLDPVARLLRTELRRGRERTGRPFDGRR